MDAIKMVNPAPYVIRLEDEGTIAKKIQCTKTQVPFHLRATSEKLEHK